MQTFTITIGLESPTLTTSEARQIALALAADCFPIGHTVVDAVGRWLSHERGIIDEPSLQIIVAGDDPETRDNVERFCRGYKSAAAQDSVMLQVTNPQTFFI
jgi:hypothetical protein